LGLLDADRASRLQRVKTRPASILDNADTATVPWKLASGPAVDVVVKDQLTPAQEGPKLTEQEQERLLRDNHLIRDRRTGEEVSKAYNTQMEVRLQNPSDTGIFEVLEDNGDFRRALVIRGGHTTKNRSRKLVGVALDDKDWVVTEADGMFAKPNTDNEHDWLDWYDGLENADLSEGGTFIIVSKRRSGTMPFHVDESFGDGRYHVYFDDFASGRRTGIPEGVRNRDYTRYSQGTRDSWGGDATLHLNDHEGTSFRLYEQDLYVPKEHKVIRLEKSLAEQDTKSVNSEEPAPISVEEQATSEPRKFSPGGVDALMVRVEKEASALKLYSTGGEVRVGTAAPMSKKQALFHLVLCHGLREKEAKTLLKQADIAGARRKPFRCFVKYARPYPMSMAGGLQPGPSAPPIPEAQYGYDDGFGQVVTQYPETHLPIVEDLSSFNTDPEIYNTLPEAMPPVGVAQQAQQAARLGQKELFDTGMFTGLLKTVRQSAMVDRYLGDLMKAMDRLGRILFMFRWHNEEFEDRYGKSDLGELEDSLVNSFESLGDLVLFLKEKDIEPLPDASLGGEPDIEEVAGN
jgi:hypothetical protein